jgi:HemY protein
MIRLLLIIAALFALAAGFEWLKDTPGELALTLGGSVYSVGLAEAALAMAIVAVISVIGYLIFRAVVTAPGKAIFAWRGRKVEKGRQALSQGLLAVASGDVRRAEHAAREAAKRLPDAPLTALLQAQTAQLKGDRDAARDTFTAMLDNPETRIAGLHGLFIEAERQGAHEAAHHYARTARETRPDTGWAARALLRYQAAAGDWDAALQTLSSANDNRSIDKKTARQLRAVLLTAKAMAVENTEPEAAKQAALEAHQLEPELAPAAVVAGRILARLGEIKRGARVLEASWKASPHPEIAEAYAYLRSGDSALDRMARMDRLFKMKPHNDEGRMALAQMALEATEFDAAREALKPIITTRPTQNALLLMADIDEAEHGDRGRVREWLARAVRAPRDPVWTADGAILEEWAPVSPVTGRIGAVEWKVPVDEGESTLSIDMEDEAFKPRDLIPAATAAAAEAGEEEPVEDAEIIDVTPQAAAGEEPKVEKAEPQKAPEAPEAVEPDEKAEPAAEAGAAGAEDTEAKETEAAKAAEAAPAEDEAPEVNEISEAKAESVAEEPAGESAETVPAEAVAEEAGAEEQEAGGEGQGMAEAVRAEAARAANDDKPAEEAATEAAKEAEAGEEAEETEEAEVVMPHVPDDPGVDDTEEPEPRRFKLF